MLRQGAARQSLLSREDKADLSRGQTQTIGSQPRRIVHVHAVGRVKDHFRPGDGCTGPHGKQRRNRTSHALTHDRCVFAGRGPQSRAVTGELIGAPAPRAFCGQAGSGGKFDLLPRKESDVRAAQSFARIVEGNRACARIHHGAPVLGRAPHATNQESSRAPRGEGIGVEIDGTGRGNTRRADQTNVRGAGDVDIGHTPNARSGRSDHAGQGQ